MGKYVIQNSKNDQFYFVLKAGNGEVILTSETYTSKQNCKKGIESSKVNILDANFEKKVSTSNQYYFVQKARNGETIGLSEMYTSAQARDNGIKSVQNNAPTAEVVDLT